MDNRKLEGSWKSIKGRVVEQVGKLVGSEKLRSEGEAERVRGRIEAAAASGIKRHSNSRKDSTDK